MRDGSHFDNADDRNPASRICEVRRRRLIAAAHGSVPYFFSAVCRNAAVITTGAGYGRLRLQTF
jgi:hypothetical protein